MWVLHDVSFRGAIAESPKPAPMSSLKEKMKSPFSKGKSDTKRIQLMLEETLMKNVQLQTVSYL